MRCAYSSRLLTGAIYLLACALLSTPANGQASVQTSGGSVCDPSLWQHVYHPQRLVVKEQCLTVRGTIVDATHGKRKDGLRHEGDGDTHGWLKLDALQQNLLNDGNKTAEGGNLVFEVICKYRVTQKDAVAACQGYKSTVVIPPVGTHVCITGSYVQDQEHAKWMEIHPVSRIESCPAMGSGGGK